MEFRSKVLVKLNIRMTSRINELGMSKVALNRIYTQCQTLLSYFGMSHAVQSCSIGILIYGLKSRPYAMLCRYELIGWRKPRIWLSHFTELISMNQSLPTNLPKGSNPWQNFRQQGINLAEWAREKGFNPQLVYLVVRGDRKCLRGQSYNIAKELGMK